jgi:hypothetical protein
VIRAFALLALLALGCAGAGDSVELDDQAVAAAPVAEWLPAEHPAAAAQARWGMPIPCSGFQVLTLPLAELQPLCNSADELAARAANVYTEGCVRPHACELDVAAELSPARRELVLTHELGHLLDPHGVDRHVQDGCPKGQPGAHLMCAGGPASGSPDPTLEDFDLVLGPYER